MKKFISTLLILFTVILPCNIFSACNNIEDRNYYTTDHNTDIAQITLFSFDGKSEAKYGLMNFGHAFIGITNKNYESINIYGYNILPNESITIGTWSIWNHWGAWFNVESNYISNYNKYDGRVSISTGISSKDINTLTKYLNNRDNWSLINNCFNFALNMWNSVAEEGEKIYKPLIYTPNYVSEQIKTFKNYETNKPIITSESVGYFKDNTFIEYKMEGA